MKYLFIILFAFTVNAQSVWYVDRDTPADEAGDGTSWAQAFKYLGNLGGNGTYGSVKWHLLSGGDTVYVSGGTDSTLYHPRFNGQAHYVGSGQDTMINYVGDPVIVTPAWHTNHNGDVYFTAWDGDRGVFNIEQINNVIVTGFNIYDTRTPATDPSPVVRVIGGDLYTDPPNIFENNIITSAGVSTGIGFDGFNVIIRNNSYTEPVNESITANDPFGGTGGMGTIIDNNTVILRNNYTAIPNMTANDSVTVGATTLIDLRLPALADADTNRYKLRANYHTGITIQINGNWNLTVTSNLDSLFTGSAGWTYATYTVSADVGNTYDTLHCYDATYTYATDYFKNTWIKAGGDSMLVTGNSGGTITGTGWLPNVPAAQSAYSFVAHAGEYPPSGTAWRMEGAHRDGIQFSTFAPHTPISDTLTTIIRNNIIVDEGVRGTGWNGIIYTSSPTAHQRWLVYNNIFVSKQEISSAGIFMYESEDSYPTQTYFGGMKFFNNTIIIKGSGSINPADGRYSTGQFFSFEDFDSLEVKNNLWICDTTMAYMGKTTYGLQYEAIDYNIYAFDFYNTDAFGFATGGGGFLNLTGWRALGFDVNSDTLQSSTITFAEKYGTDKADYLTTTGRNEGTDLSSIFTTDALGNPRVAPYDIGAVEYQAPATRKRYRAIIIQ